MQTSDTHEVRTRRMLDANRRGRFGQLLRKYRYRAGLSQEQLAERAGRSLRGIQDLERGVRRTPYPATVRRVADALELDESDRRSLMEARSVMVRVDCVHVASSLAEFPAGDSTAFRVSPDDVGHTRCFYVPSLCSIPYMAEQECTGDTY